MPIMNVLKRVLWGFSVVAGLFAPIDSRAAEGSINWQVLNRFRSFDFSRGTENNTRTSADRFRHFSPKAGDGSTASWLSRIIAAGGSPMADDPGAWFEHRNADHPGYTKALVIPPARVAVQFSLGNELSHSLEADATCLWRLDGNTIGQARCREPFDQFDFPFAGGTVEVEWNGQMLATEIVKPVFRIILGLGDSYAAGEGNPDRPTIWSKRRNADTWQMGTRENIDWLVDKPAAWWSNRCNRSFYSYQNFVALRLAAENPHGVLSFVHLACAGAEVTDGLLAPQRLAPGHPENCTAPNDRRDKNSVDPQCDVSESQMRAAVRLLCQDDAVPAEASLVKDIDKALAGVRQNADQRAWIKDLQQCPPGRLQAVDKVLLSIGGNDIGFGGVVAWGLLPLGRSAGIPIFSRLSHLMVGLARRDAHVVCPIAGAPGCLNGKLPASERINELKPRYDALSLALAQLLNVEGDQIVLNRYPNPLRDEKGRLCGDKPFSNTVNAWYSARMLIPISPESWQINLTKWEAEQVETHVIRPLNRKIESEASARRWVSPDIEHVMDGAGWCTGQDVALIPPSEVYSWHPYAPNTRLIRTTNDSALSQWSGHDDREDGISGTFHPNAFGQAAMADAVLHSLGSQ